MSKDPGYSDSRKDTLESRNRFLQDKISELTSEVAALDEAKQFFQERNEILINKIEYLNLVNDGLHLLLKEAEARENKLKAIVNCLAHADANAIGATQIYINNARQVLKEIGEE